MLPNFPPFSEGFTANANLTSNSSHLRDPLLGPDVVGVLRELVDELLHLDVELDGAELDRFCDLIKQPIDYVFR